MADLLFNIDGKPQTFKNVTHLLANTASGGKAVYTEDSDTTTAYVLKDPEGEIPTYDESYQGYVSGDGKIRCLVYPNNLTSLGVDMFIYIDGNTHNCFFYSSGEITMSAAAMEALLASVSDTWAGGDILLKPGWNYIENGTLIYRKVADTAWVQQKLRELGGIPTDTFAFASMEAYTKSFFEQTEIVAEKTVQPNYAQNDYTAPDYIKGRFGGFLLPEIESTTIEWDGEIGEREYFGVADGDDAIYYVKVSDTPIYVAQALGASLTLTSNDDSGTPRTNTYIIHDDYNSMAFLGFGFQTESIVSLFEDNEVFGITLTRGLWFIRINGTYVSKLVTNADGEYEPTPPARFIEPQNSIVLKSTTSGSTKKYKITVDDTGTLTTTEVTS